MGKKPVLGLAGLFLAGVTLSGCQNTGGGRGAAGGPPPMMGAKNSATPDSRPNMVPGPRPDLASGIPGAPRGGMPANPVSPVGGSTGTVNYGGNTVVPVGAGSALGNPGARPAETFGSGGNDVPSSFQQQAAPSGLAKPLPTSGVTGSGTFQAPADNATNAMPSSFKSDPVYPPAGNRTPANPSSSWAVPATGAHSTSVDFPPPPAAPSNVSIQQTTCPGGSPSSNSPAPGATIAEPQSQMPSLSPSSSSGPPL